VRHAVSASARFRLSPLGVAHGTRLILAACSVAALATTTLAAQTVTLQASADATLKQGSPDRSLTRS
jgi:hypothetical protein